MKANKHFGKIVLNVDQNRVQRRAMTWTIELPVCPWPSWRRSPPPPPFLAICGCRYTAGSCAASSIR